MEETEYRKTYQRVNPLACPFERAILTGCSGCEKAARLLLAEREAVACRVPAAHAECVELHSLLRDKGQFALRLSQIPGALPHGKEMKVQCGGLLGLQAAVAPSSQEAIGVRSVYALVQAARKAFGTLQGLPFSEIVKSMAAFQSRHHRGRRRR